jgi:APA family basic amino acid/polyamine antiporter
MSHNANDSVPPPPTDAAPASTATSGELQRRFGLSTATFVVVASMVGAGILISPGYMMASLHNYTAIFGLWLLGGLLAICGALCVAELAAALPRAGGEYVYLREAYGPMPAFLSGWTSFVLGFSAPLAVAASVAATYLLAPFGLTEGDGESSRLVQAVAAMIIVVITVPNLLGYRQSAWTQNLTTLLKLGLFVALVLAGFLFGTGKMSYLTQGKPLQDVDLGTAATQLFYVMFAYTGWNAASYLAGEVKNPGKVLPRSLLLGSLLVIGLYFGLNLVFAYAVPLTDVTFDNAEQVPQLAAQRLFGTRISNAFSVGVGLTFLATVSAFIVTGPRVYYAMAKDGLFPSIAARINPHTQVPTYAMVAQSLCAMVILFSGRFQNIYQFAAVGLGLFSMLIIAAVFVLRIRQPQLERPFRTPLYPVVPAIFLLVTVFTTVYAFKMWGKTPAIGLATILAGIPIYYLWRFIQRMRRKP